MNANDRFALELGRALVRALIAEAALAEAKAQLSEFQTEKEPA